MHCFALHHQYEACDPDDADCLEKRCRHPIVSLQERAEELGYEPMAKYIDKYKSGQVICDIVASP